MEVNKASISLKLVISSANFCIVVISLKTAATAIVSFLLFFIGILEVNITLLPKFCNLSYSGSPVLKTICSLVLGTVSTTLCPKISSLSTSKILQAASLIYIIVSLSSIIMMPSCNWSKIDFINSTSVIDITPTIN